MVWFCFERGHLKNFYLFNLVVFILFMLLEYLITAWVYQFIFFSIHVYLKVENKNQVSYSQNQTYNFFNKNNHKNSF